MTQNSASPHEDRAHPCSCPPEVVRWLQLAVDYVKAGVGRTGDQGQVLGALSVKTFMEQPWEGWCSYVSPEKADSDA